MDEKTRKKGLGRGLSTLLAETKSEANESKFVSEQADIYLPIEKIFNGKTPIEDIEISENAFEHTKIKKLEIPEGITSIPEFCFLSSTIFYPLRLPSTIETIGRYAFSNAKISDLNLP